MKFTIIIGTLGNKSNLDNALNSLENQIEKDFEVIIIDQSRTNLKPILKRKLKINHIKSSKKGLSRARNLGIKKAKGKFIVLMDDDATLKEDFLKKATRYTNIFDCISGVVLEERTKKHLARSIKTGTNRIISLNNYNDLMSSATIISTKEIKAVGGFDEELGVGNRYGSGEETDVLLRLLSQGKKAYFCKDLIAYHPSESLILQKLGFSQAFKRGYSYGLGRGALLKKQYLNKRKAWAIKEEVKIVIMPCIGLCINLLKLRGRYALRDFGGVIGRVRGFIEYKK